MSPQEELLRLRLKATEPDDAAEVGRLIAGGSDQPAVGAAWPTPGSLTVQRNTGSARLPPGRAFAPTSKTLAACTLAVTGIAITPATRRATGGQPP
ncbi:hypothetical protein [Lentzea flaviverrucosa]|uniref:hypothetical protein n=1 Tax=Lentzea flaviverrucosa TaxID=200379 RepID=UPI000B7F1F47|nr:hypothetical protein [Lentzea flaviverrucosa]